MQVIARRDERTRTVTITATWTDWEQADAVTDPADLAMLREPTATGADVLLDAELIVRRIQEAQNSAHSRYSPSK